MEKKQNSVEYLMEMIKLNSKDFYAMLFEDKVFEQAKAMHKEERISDYYQGACDESDNHGAQSIIRADLILLKNYQKK